MERQRGSKRAAKVLSRKRKLNAQARAANLRRFERKAELAEKEEKEKAQKSK